jgi:hypothetical protein
VNTLTDKGRRALASYSASNDGPVDDFLKGLKAVPGACTPCYCQTGPSADRRRLLEQVDEILRRAERLTDDVKSLREATRRVRGEAVVGEFRQNFFRRDCSILSPERKALVARMGAEAVKRRAKAKMRSSRGGRLDRSGQEATEAGQIAFT